MTNPKLSELRAMIHGTIEAFPNITQRALALSAIQWRLRGPNGEFVGMKGFWTCAFVSESEALVFDARDNEAQKLAFYQTALCVPLTVEILPQHVTA